MRFFAVGLAEGCWVLEMRVEVLVYFLVRPVPRTGIPSGVENEVQDVDDEEEVSAEEPDSEALLLLLSSFSTLPSLSTSMLSVAGGH